MKLGSLNIKNNLLLAPLHNVTTGPYRRFCRHFFNIGLVSIPMLYTERFMQNCKNVEFELYKIEEEHPISVQLICSEQYSLIQAIKYLESYRFDILDINAGCPSRRAINGKKGGYLLKDLKKLKLLLETAVKFSSRPVSLKSRIGYENSKTIDEFATLINDSGIEFLTIHARPVVSRFDDSKLSLDTLKSLKEILNIPLVGNGDINNPKFAKYFLEDTNVDALMIGRGSMGYPEIFSHIYMLLSKGIEQTYNNNLSLMKSHFELYEKYLDDFLNGCSLNCPIEEYKFNELKRNAIWFTKNIKDSSSIRTELSHTKNLIQLKNILNNIYFN